MAQHKVALDAQRFSTGLTWKDYMAQMGDTRARTEENYQKAQLTEEERKTFAGFTHVKYAMMLAENWCGDVHRNSPLIAHICETLPGCELRVFFRDQNADLRDSYLNNGFQSIPVVVFYTRAIEYLYHYIEYPAIYHKDRVLAQLRAPRAGESKEQTQERGLRDFFALQRSPFFTVWACAGIDEMLSALHERLVVGSLA